MPNDKRKASLQSGRSDLKRQKIAVDLTGLDSSSASGLSSLSNNGDSDDDSLPLAQQQQNGGKTLSALPSNVLPGSATASPSPAGSPAATPDSGPKARTSQKGVGMSRTVQPSEQSTAPSVASKRHKDASQAEKAMRRQEAIQVKQEADDGPISTAAIASGVSIDAEDLTSSSHTNTTRERPAIAEEEANNIRFTVVQNESDPEPSTMIILTGLKNLFQKQLPKMPREYIARLVYDREHLSMAIVKRGLQVVGGITYRPFQQRGFAEIVFCAVTGTEQVRGYGSHLMNHLKDHVRAAHPGIEHFLTYADNYAVGYFKKQGFTKEISLDRALWAAYIKDYEGGTLMQCSMLPKIQYLQARAILNMQKEAILSKIRQFSQSHIVHSGRDVFPEGVTLVKPSDVPGLRELNWNPDLDELSRRPQRGPQHMVMRRVLTDLQQHASAWPFLKPVNKDEVADYYEVIKQPMDLDTMEFKLEGNHYPDLDAFITDAQLIFSNCRAYNAESSNYVKNANKLERYMRERVKVYTE